MSFKEYLKDRLLTFSLFLAAWGMTLIFLFGFHLPYSLMAVISVIWLGAVTAAVLADYCRKKTFYDKLNQQLANLDQKYLITEMIDEPAFYEGRLLCDILEETDKSMCESVSEYRRKSADFREFIELWVHEVKLPVASLQLMAHNHKSELNPQFMEQLRRIDGYTDTVLYYARSENAEKDYIIKEVSLKKTVSGTIIKYRDDLLLRNVSIQTDSLAAAVMTDGKWLEYILGQLLSNSLKYFSTEREPEISISAEDQTDKVILHFRDNGIGIPENDIPYVFQKSFTGDNGRTHSKSTGMGLYICYHLCEKLGHRLGVQSVQGEFTEFTIAFAKNDFYKMQ